MEVFSHGRRKGARKMVYHETICWKGIMLMVSYVSEREGLFIIYAVPFENGEEGPIANDIILDISEKHLDSMNDALEAKLRSKA